MEHATLHAVLLTGLIVALGGPIAALWLFIPASRAPGSEGPGAVPLDALLEITARWTMIGALAAAFATFVDFFVAIAEFNNQTVFAGADLSEVWRFASTTHVGLLCLLRLGLLLLTAVVVRLPMPRKFLWWFTGVIAFAAIVATGNVSHAAAQPGDNPVPVIAQVSHIAAAALWMGVLLQIFLGRGLLLGSQNGPHTAFLAATVRRFSPLALAMTSLLGITGVIAAIRYLTGVGIVIHSPYGLTLCVKLTVLLPAIYAGWINFRRNVPALNRLASSGGDPAQRAGVFSRFSRMLELEVTAGLLVITVAGILGSISPPGDDGSYQLTREQAQAFLHPHLPQTNIAGWDLPDDPVATSPHEKRYAEFTHNWSGTMVCLMGLAWLALSFGGRAAVWAGRIFPFVLMLFGLFIAAAANPEIWIRHYSFLQAVSDPILLEHQLGGSMVFILAWLTWRDRRTPVEKQPLGYPLPVIMIVGSLLLLGHAHTLSTVPDDLTNLINTQHAVFGALGLFAGTTRLLMLRGLVPGRIARFVWPSFVFTLGIFMTFFYRELIV